MWGRINIAITLCICAFATSAMALTPVCLLTGKEPVLALWASVGMALIVFFTALSNK